MNYLHTLVLIPILGFVSIGFAQEQEVIPPVEDIIEEEVFIDEFGTVDLIVNETEVSQVLEMLSIQSQKNIIASNNVTGVVSANLYDVTFNEALDAILRVNGFAYVEEGNFVYVYTIEELAIIEQARRRRRARLRCNATDARPKAPSRTQRHGAHGHEARCAMCELERSANDWSHSSQHAARDLLRW